MRHIEKLKKIFTCCGKECSADTNGAALDELLTLAENGELGGGSSSGEDDTPEIQKYYTGRGYATAIRFKKNAEVIITNVEGDDTVNFILNKNIGNEKGLYLTTGDVQQVNLTIDGEEKVLTLSDT